MGGLNMDKIYILHGWSYSVDKWKIFTGLLKRQGFDVHILKIPGLTMESSKIWDLRKYSDWLTGEMGSSKVVLLGHSNGGRIASYFAWKHPERVQKLILVDSAGIYHKDPRIQIKRFIFGKAAQVGKKFTKSEVFRKFLYSLAGESDYKNAPPNMQKSMINLIGVDLVGVFKKIKVKTLIIWGENDKVTPVSDGMLINKLIRESRLVKVKNAAHSPQFSNPDDVLLAVKDFLA